MTRTTIPSYKGGLRPFMTYLATRPGLRAPVLSHRLSQGRRLVDAANQTLQPNCESAPLRLREKTAQLALTAVRLDREPARMQPRCRAAEFNLRPMPREHVSNGMLPVAQLYADVRVGNRNRLPVVASGHAHSERPSQECHFESRERQHWPEAPAGHDPRNPERHEAQAPEKQHSGANTEGAVRTDFNALQLGVH